MTKVISNKTKQAIKKNYPKKRVLLLETLLLLILPITIIKLVPEFILFRHIVLIFGATYLLFINKIFRINSKQVGLTAKNLSPALKDIISPTIILFVIFLILAVYQTDLVSMKEGVYSPIPKAISIALYVFISIPLQELIFRGFIVKRLSLVSKNSMFIIFYTSLVFGAAHLIFTNPGFAIITFLISIKWTQNYLKYQNLWPIIYSHAILGSVMLLATF